MSGALKEWLRDRLGLDDLLHLAQKKEVPAHRHTFWYYWGGMTLFLFGVQVATGILLLLYYRASADEAYESVRFLMTQVSFGWLIRSIHSWSATSAVASAGSIATWKPKKRVSVPPVIWSPPSKSFFMKGPTTGRAPVMSVPTLVVKNASWFHGRR